WIVGARHRERAALVLLARELGLQVRQVRAARAGAGGIARLRHEAWDHAMEHDPVVETLAREFLDARDMAGREIGAQRNDHGPRLQIHDDGVFLIARHFSTVPCSVSPIARQRWGW